MLLSVCLLWALKYDLYGAVNSEIPLKGSWRSVSRGKADGDALGSPRRAWGCRWSGRSPIRSHDAVAYAGELWLVIVSPVWTDTTGCLVGSRSCLFLHDFCTVSDINSEIYALVVINSIQSKGN